MGHWPFALQGVMGREPYINSPCAHPRGGHVLVLGQVSGAGWVQGRVCVKVPSLKLGGDGVAQAQSQDLLGCWAGPGS